MLIAVCIGFKHFLKRGGKWLKLTDSGLKPVDRLERVWVYDIDNRVTEGVSIQDLYGTNMYIENLIIDRSVGTLSIGAWHFLAGKVKSYNNMLIQYGYNCCNVYSIRNELFHIGYDCSISDYLVINEEYILGITEEIQGVVISSDSVEVYNSYQKIENITLCGGI